MKKGRSKSIQYKLFVIACIYYLADLLLPLMQYYSSVYVNIFFVLVILLTIFGNSYSIRKHLPPFLLITLLTLTDKLLLIENIKDFLLAFYNTILIFLPILLSIYLIYKNNYKLIRLLVFISIIFLSVTSITSIIGLVQYPFASRDLASGIAEKSDLTIYAMFNIGGFDLVYMIPVILPMIVAMFLSKNIRLILLLLFTLPLAYFVYKSQYTIGIISLVIVIFSLFVFYKYSHLKLVLITFIIVPVILLFGSLFFIMFQEVADTQTTEVSERLNSLIDLVQVGKSDSEALEGRQEKYNKSFKSFLSSPIVGNRLFNADSIGGHSFILDKLAAYGLIGIVALFLFYIKIIGMFYRPYKKHPFYGYMILSLYISLFLSVFNTSPNIFAISFFVPAVAYIIQYKNRNNRLNHPVKEKELLIS